MSIMDLQPKKKNRVMDLVQRAGLDVSDWSNYKNGDKNPAANPRYCYEWCFEDHDRRLIVYSAWHSNLLESGGRIFYKFNMRRIADGLHGPQKKRALNIDFAMQKAGRLNLPVRVIICDGEGAKRDEATLENAKVLYRDLDMEPWSVEAYDEDGNCVLVRGEPVPTVVDQFFLGQEQPGRVQSVSTRFQRDASIRTSALSRSGGMCEWCGARGFTTRTGSIYLETHHIEPLSEGGADSLGNVIGLCPNHHREAHYGTDTSGMRLKMQEIIQIKTGG